MGSIIVRIGGQDVRVPNDEIPRIVSELSEAYTHQLATAETATRNGFVTYDTCSEAIAKRTGYTDRKLKMNAGNLWNLMCNLTRLGTLHFDTICSICEGRIEDEGGPNKVNCSHHDRANGYHLILIGRSSIIKNFEQLRELELLRGPSIKKHYTYLLAELNQSS